MSRYYRVEVDVTTGSGLCAGEVESRLEAWGMDVDDVKDGFDDTADYTAHGHMSLGGGQTEAEAHAELKKLFQGHKLCTRWLCLDVHEWDAVVDDMAEEKEDD